MPSILIIGASRGIGKQWIHHYLKKTNPNYQIFATCRNPDKDLIEFNQNDQVKILKLDIGNDECISQLKNSPVLPEKLDICVLNAGILYRDTCLDEANTKDMIDMYNVNSIGPIRVAQGLQDRINFKDCKFLLTSSIAGSCGTAYDGKMPIDKNIGYRMSKSAANMSGLVINKTLANTTVGIIHPGFVQTDMTSWMPGGLGTVLPGVGAMISPKESVDKMDKVLGNLNENNSGKYWHYEGYELPW